MIISGTTLNWTEEIVHGVRVFVDQGFAASLAKWQKKLYQAPQSMPSSEKEDTTYSSDTLKQRGE